MTLGGRALDFAKEHVALTVSLLLAVLVVLRALYFARYDLPTAFLVLTLTSQATLLITTLAMALVVAATFVWVFDPWGQVDKAHRPDTPIRVVFLTTLGVTVLLPLIYGTFMTPVLLMLIFLGITGLFVIRIVRARRHKPVSSKNRNRAAWFGGMISGAVLASMLSQPWMPSEQIRTATSSDAVSGYVVGEQGGQLLVLDRRRQPVWIKVSDISSREVCQVNTLPPEYRWLTAPITSSGNRPKLPECADA